jgi:hypothetical protein
MQRLLAVLSVTLMAVSLSVRAADQPPSKPDTTDQQLQKDRQQAAYDQERLRREFSAFQQKLLAMAQRYEKSAKPEEREKALVLRQAITLAEKEGVDNQFNKLVVTLTSSGITVGELNAAVGQNEMLTKALREMIAILLSDNQSAKLKEEQLRLQDLLKRLEKLIRDQKLERSKTESGRVEADQLARGQAKVTDDTRKLSKVMDGKDGKDGKGERDTKGEARGEGKNGKPQAEGRDDTKDPKGDAKDPQGGEGKPNEPKDGAGKPSEPKDGQQGEAKGGQPGEGQGQPQGNEAKPRPENTPDGAQPMDPAENKARTEGKGENKPGQGEGQARGPKDGQGQPSQGQQGQPGQPKGEGQQGQQGQPGEGQPGQQQPPPDGEEPTPGRERVKDAIENQDNAEKNLQKNDRKKASNEQDEAVQKLEAARKEIERRLKQLREEEMERILANLEARCQKMLAMQTEVYDNTKRIHTAIEAYPDRKATRMEVQKAGDQSTREGEIVIEANKAIQLLEEDGTAIAVPQVLEQARDYMVQVQGRLFKTDVGAFTQETEEEIISMLKEVIEALKKAQQDLKDRKDQPPPPPNSGPPPPQTLIGLLAELKMIRSLQVRVNTRTTSYGKQYPGEQADDNDIQKELRNLAQRQDKIQKATKDIATGKVGGTPQ